MVIGYRHYLVKAQSCEGWYAVDPQEGCTCKGYQCTQHCRHFETIQMLEAAYEPLRVADYG